MIARERGPGHMGALPRRLAVILLCLLGVTCKTGPITVEIEQSELQARVAAQFPQALTHPLGRLTLENPVVVMTEGSDRLGLALDATLAIALLPPLTAKFSVSGKPHYEQASKAFFLREPRVEKLEVPGVAGAHAEQLRAVVEAVALPTLERLPVYELKQRNLKEVTAEHVLQSVWMKNGKLVAELVLSR